MANIELIIAVVALVVSVIAPLTALIQLLADLFATAEGRRKTSEQVMGPIGRLTVREKHLLLKELRYEVFYITPRIALEWTSRSETTRDKKIYRPSSRTGKSLVVQMNEKLEFATSYSFRDDIIAEFMKEKGHREGGWQVLLTSISDQISSPATALTAAGMPGLHNNRPGVILQEWAWDMLPDDVGRAIASTTLFDILVIRRRLGATWTTSNMSLEHLRAEGNGHVFTPTNLQGLGAAIIYQRVGNSTEAIECKRENSSSGDEEASSDKDTHQRISLQSWTVEADKLMFGICPKNPAFKLPDFPINDCDALSKTWTDQGWLDVPWQSREYSKGTDLNKERVPEKEIPWAHLFSSKKRGNELRHATDDLIALACPMLRTNPQTHFAGRQVLLPFSDDLENMFQGLDEDHKGRRTFLKRLEEAMTAENATTLQNIVSMLGDLAAKVPENDRECSLFLKKPHDGYQWTTKYFMDIKTRGIKNANQFYFHLMRAHLSRSPFVHGEAVRNWKKRVDREYGKLKIAKRRLRSEQVHVLFDSIHYFQDFMKNAAGRDYDKPELVKEAWIVLFFRGMCWSLCHAADELVEFLPVEFYASQMPIYLL